MTTIRALFVFGLITLVGACMCSPFARAATTAPGKTQAISDADRVVHELCGKSVALLGESPMHGSAKTWEFKVALIPRLIDECHYSAFFIESGIYDFLNIQKRLKSGQEVTESMVSAAIGGLWAAREVQPLIPFLLERAREGRIALGGLDDQLQKGSYAQHQMPSDLVKFLEGEERTRCLAILQKHTLWQYTDDSPYSPQDKALILGCLDSIETSLNKAPASKVPFREYDMPMLESFGKPLAWDFRQSLPKGLDENLLEVNERDKWMYSNFRWLLSRLPPHSKVIVWAANTHVAKDLSGVPGEEGVVPFGAYVHREFKSRAFALGFSAYSGSYARTGQPVRPLSVAPPDSLEARALAGRDADSVYLSSKELRQFGSVPARLRGEFQAAQWSKVVDGMVIFREEYAPQFIGH